MTSDRREVKLAYKATPMIEWEGREICLPNCVNDQEGGKEKVVYPIASMIKGEGGKGTNSTDNQEGGHEKFGLKIVSYLRALTSKSGILLAVFSNFLIF